MNQSSRILFVIFFISIISCKDREPVIPKSEQDYCALLKANEIPALSNSLKSITENQKSKQGAYVLEEGGEAMISRAWLSESAEKSIDIQYFIFSTDNIGLIACDYLVRAADRGVKVRIIVDDILVDAPLTDIITLDAHPNIEIKIYNPGINLGKNLFQKLKKLSTDFRSANQRMHNKTFIVDGTVCITGGRNIADEYFDFNRNYNFRDRDVLLIGENVEDIESSFELFWNNHLSVDASSFVHQDSIPEYKPENFNRLHQYACNPDNYWPSLRSKLDSSNQFLQKLLEHPNFHWIDSVEYVSDLPGKNEETTKLSGSGLSTKRLTELIQNAKKKVSIQTPYLITTDWSRSLFKEIIDKNVSIKILTNSLASTDNLEAFSSYQSERKELLKTGVDVFEYKPDAAIRKEIMLKDLQEKIDFTPTFGLHAKTMIIDDHITVIGTFNLDPRSANLNTECFVVIYSKEINETTSNLMEKELGPTNAWKITEDFNPDHFVSKTKRIKTWTRKVLPKEIL